MQEKQITIMLRSLGITHSYLGYRRIVLAVTLALDNPDRLEAVIKEIYRAAGRRSSAPCARSATAPGRSIPGCCLRWPVIRCGAPLRPPSSSKSSPFMPHAILSFRYER